MLISCVGAADSPCGIFCARIPLANSSMAHSIAGRFRRPLLQGLSCASDAVGICSASSAHAGNGRSASWQQQQQQHRRQYGGGQVGLQAPSRAFPSYSIFGTDALLTLKPLLPTFKPAGGDGVALDRRGKMMLSFTPSSSSAGPGGDAGAGGGGSSGNWKWQEQLNIALTVEEVGLLVNQLPMHEVEICRTGAGIGANRAADGGGEYSLARPDAEISDAPDKVLTVTPGDGATVVFVLDFVRDGVGGQISPLDENSRHAPLEVVAQAGDFEVCKNLLESSIPQLLGWNAMMDIGIQNMINRSGGGYGGGGGGGSGGGYGYGGGNRSY